MTSSVDERPSVTSIHTPAAHVLIVQVLEFKRSNELWRDTLSLIADAVVRETHGGPKVICANLGQVQTIVGATAELDLRPRHVCILADRLDAMKTALLRMPSNNCCRKYQTLCELAVMHYVG